MATPQQQRPSKKVVLLFGVLLACIILLGTSYFSWSPASVKNKKKYTPSERGRVDLVEYGDVDEFIDEDTIPEFFLPISPSSSRQHSLDELQELVRPISTEILPPITIILPYQSSIDMLESQLASIHIQSVPPYSIWIICETEDGKHFVEQQKFPYSNIQILFRHDKMVPLPSTEYIWVLGLGVLPGRRHLELLLKLSQTPEYRNTLVGTGSTIRFGSRKNKVECRPGTAAQGNTATAQILNGAWLLRREWLVAASLDSKPGDLPLGYWISRNLGPGGRGIPLITLPGDTGKIEDYVLKGVSDKDECAMLEDYFKKSNRLGLEDKVMMMTAQDTLPPPPTTDTIVFLIDEDNMENDWVQLACGMHGNPEDIKSAVHIVTMSDTINCPSFPPHRIHSMNTRLQRMADVHPTEMVQQLMQLFTTIDARVIVYIEDGGTLHRTADIAKSIMADTAVMIGLPQKSLPHIGWLIDLPVRALSQWHLIRIKLVITTEGSDPKPFDRLYDSIQNSELLNDRIDLMVYMESNLKNRTQDLVEHTVWSHGTKDIRHRIVPADRASMFVEAWYPANNDEYAIVLDDGMEVSPLFYIWAKYAILKYRYAMPREDHLYGISLLTPRLLDTAEDAHQRFLPPSDAGHAPFLMQTPPGLGGGAIYFPEHWREFHDYMNARIADHVGLRLQKVEVPELKSRNWSHSWRRYMDELVYLRGNVMLYPNFDDHASFATRNKLVIQAKANATAMRISVLPFYTVPLASGYLIDALPDQHLPEFSKMEVLDIWGKPVPSLDTLFKRGRDLQKKASACTPTDDYLFDPSDLLCPFARVVKTLPDEIKVPLPTKTITVYLPAHPTS